MRPNHPYLTSGVLSQELEWLGVEPTEKQTDKQSAKQKVQRAHAQLSIRQGDRRLQPGRGP